LLPLTKGKLGRNLGGIHPCEVGIEPRPQKKQVKPWNTYSGWEKETGDLRAKCKMYNETFGKQGGEGLNNQTGGTFKGEIGVSRLRQYLENQAK